ncbi:DUF421 domain-containing protein [Paenibacillus sp. 481]|uniref:YetF domain-containing protein n=1 Tax=Paenibacillus sp. 481 TaxID=2835869 RepID=UPI001E54F032|nr:DUF421 domain-containing protein [Paenibacillus sp. 481]UHA75385.1 DUF421 domain-containing protein [Paenibacillus sp. 481]
MPDWLIVIYRTWIAMVVLFSLTKLLGKRQVSQLSLFEYLTGLTVGGLAVFISLNTDGRWILGVISLLVWVLTSFGVEWAQLKSKRFRDLLHAKGTVLIRQGRILERNMRKERLTIDEMMIQLRNKNAFHLADVEFAIMEPSGEINVMLKSANRPLTVAHAHAHAQASLTNGYTTVGAAEAISKLDLESEPEPTIVLMDGTILEDSLFDIGKDVAWLEGELKQRNLTPEQVFIVQVDGKFQLYIDVYSHAAERARLGSLLSDRHLRDP